MLAPLWATRTGTSDGIAAAPTGIDRAGVEAWFERTSKGSSRRFPSSESSRPLEPHLRGRRRLRAALGPAAATARQVARLRSRHGPRAQGRLGARPQPRCRWRPSSASARTTRSTTRLLRDGVRRGAILRGLAEAEAFPGEADRRAIGERVADTTVWTSTRSTRTRSGSGPRPQEDYVARQLHRWQGQWENRRARVGGARRRPRAARGAHPRAGPGDDRHGDYRLDTDLTPGGEGWRRWSTGSSARSATRSPTRPLMVYWPERGEDPSPSASPPTWLPASPRPGSCATATPSAHGRDLSQLDFLRRPRILEVAIILEGVYARYAAGQYGKVNEGIEGSPAWSSAWPRRPRWPRPAADPRPKGQTALSMTLTATGRLIVSTHPSNWAWSVRAPPPAIQGETFEADSQAAHVWRT